MKKLLSIAAFAALTLSAANAGSATYIENSTDNVINQEIEILATAVVGFAAIDSSQLGTKFVGANINMGSMGPVDLSSFGSYEQELFVRFNGLGVVTMNIDSADGNGDLVNQNDSTKTIPMHYTIGSSNVDLASGSTDDIELVNAPNDGQSAITNKFKAWVDTTDSNTIAGVYKKTLTVTITAS